MNCNKFAVFPIGPISTDTAMIRHIVCRLAEVDYVDLKRPEIT